MATYPQPFTAQEREEQWLRFLAIDVTCSLKGEVQSFISILKSTEDLSLHNSSDLSDSRRRTRADDKRTIHQDILRTRADDVFFRSKIFLLEKALEAFCVYHRVNYMQGLNEILAPIMTIGQCHRPNAKNDIFIYNDEVVDNVGQQSYREQLPTFEINLLMFELLVKKLCPATFASKGVNALQSQLTTFHLILTYHDPLLSMFLRDRDMTPDIYAMSWFITLFARKTPIHIVLCLWDIMLQLDDPINIIFIAVAFLCSYREDVFQQASESLPQRLVSFCFRSEEHVLAVTRNAMRLKLWTPFTVQAEALKLGFRARLNEYEREFGIHDMMSRPCMFVDSNEVVQSMLKGPELSTTHTCMYTFLDCRHAMSASSAVQFRNRIQIPTEIQDEVCNAVARESKAKRKRRENISLGKYSSSAGEAEDASSGKASGLISVLSLEACTILSVLWNAFADTIDYSSSHCLPIHLVIMDDYVPELPDLSIFSPADPQQQQQQDGDGEEFPSPSISPYHSPRKSWSSHKPRGASSDSTYGLSTAYRRSPTYSASNGGDDIEQQDHSMKDFYSSWFLGMNSRISLMGGGSGSFNKTSDKHQHTNNNSLPQSSAKGKVKGNGKLSSSPRATAPPSVSHVDSKDSVGEVYSDRAHAFSSALIILGFPRLSILQHNLLPPVSTSTSEVETTTTDNHSKSEESGEALDGKQFSDLIQGMSISDSRSPVQAMARDMFNMKIPVRRRYSHSLQTVHEIAPAMYHFPTTTNSTTTATTTTATTTTTTLPDGGLVCMACAVRVSNRRTALLLPKVVVEICLPVNHTFYHRVLCYVLGLLSHVNVSTFPADTATHLRSRSGGAEEEDTDLYATIKRKTLGKLILQMLDEQELLVVGSGGSRDADTDNKSLESMDGEFLLIRSVDLTRISEVRQAEGAGAAYTDNDSMSLMRLFSHLQSLTHSSTTIQATILLTIAAHCLSDSTTERVIRAVILLQRLLCHGHARRSSLQYILQCSQAVVIADGKVWADVLSLIEDLQSIHTALEATERVKKKLDLVNEKTQMTSYRILQSKALTKYARNRVRSLVTKESSLDEK